MATAKRVQSSDSPDVAVRPKAAGKKIHPITIYPFSHPKDTKHVEGVYDKLIAPLAAEPGRYAKPITVMNRQTHWSNILWKYDPELNKDFADFRDDRVKQHSTVIDDWCVDTCQMWLAGLRCHAAGRTDRTCSETVLAERNQQQADWSERFKKLDGQSGQIRGAALVILENLLVYP